MSLLPTLDHPTPCAGNWALFDSTDYRDHQAAKALCATCPVFKECWDNLQDVLKSDSSRGGSPVGTWAGMLFGQHGNTTRPAKTATTVRANCGTDGGYRMHYLKSEKPCTDCRTAHAVARKERRKQQKDAA